MKGECSEHWLFRAQCIHTTYRTKSLWWSQDKSLWNIRTWGYSCLRTWTVCKAIPKFLFVFFLGPYLQHMEVLRLGVKSELQLPAYTTATGRPDPRHVFDLHHSSWQCWILNPLSQARDCACVLMNTSWVHYRWATMGTLIPEFLLSWSSYYITIILVIVW